MAQGVGVKEFRLGYLKNWKFLVLYNKHMYFSYTYLCRYLSKYFEFFFFQKKIFFKGIFFSHFKIKFSLTLLIIDIMLLPLKIVYYLSKLKKKKMFLSRYYRRLLGGYRGINCKKKFKIRYFFSRFFLSNFFFLQKYQKSLENRFDAVLITLCDDEFLCSEVYKLFFFKKRVLFKTILSLI